MLSEALCPSTSISLIPAFNSLHLKRKDVYQPTCSTPLHRLTITVHSVTSTNRHHPIETNLLRIQEGQAGNQIDKISLTAYQVHQANTTKDTEGQKGLTMPRVLRTTCNRQVLSTKEC